MKTVRPTLTFDKKDMKDLIVVVKERTEEGEKATVRIVGDEGIYFMPPWPVAGEENPHIVYAKEADASKLSMEEWWDAKRATWGGDDGCEVIPVSCIESLLNAEGTTALAADISPSDIRFRAV